jgi:hypothetical protein
VYDGLSHAGQLRGSWCRERGRDGGCTFTYNGSTAPTSAGTPMPWSQALQPNASYTNATIGSMTIDKRSVVADSKSKFLNNPVSPDPSLTFQITSGSLVSGDAFSGALTRAVGETVGTYAISQGALTLSTNYTLTYIGANLYILAVNITGPVGPIAKGNSATVTASFLNSGTQATPICTFDWDDTTTTTVPMLVGTNWICSATRTFAAAGVYEVRVTVTDANTGSTTVSFQYVVIYDASGGFVTGGGWINSPPGAYVANPTLTGKANFGFVSKYQKGANVPTGETEFQFNAAGFNFHSTVYDWLVIAGAKAQYKGSGTINDSGDYGFLLTATDGKVSGGGVDKFRIKVWNKTTGAIAYDNAPGSDDIDASNQMALGGGSITVHK